MAKKAHKPAVHGVVFREPGKAAGGGRAIFLRAAAAVREPTGRRPVTAPG
jgi:hypothetical protein